VGGAAEVRDAVTGDASEAVDVDMLVEAGAAGGVAVETTAGVANPDRAEYFSRVGHQLESTEFLSRM